MTSDEQQLLALDLSRRAAMIALDVATLDRLFSERLTYIHTTGLLETKAEVLVGLGKGMRFTAFEPLKDETVVIDGDTGLVTTELAVSIARGGEAEASLRLRTCISSIWTRGADGWRLSVYHAGRLAD